MKKWEVLSRVNSPKDIKGLTYEELKRLAEEIREYIIDVVSKNGGHLASSLGAIELTLALHKVFEAPRDKIIWDVGHQAYAHKIITGRRGKVSGRSGAVERKSITGREKTRTIRNKNSGVVKSGKPVVRSERRIESRSFKRSYPVVKGNRSVERSRSSGKVTPVYRQNERARTIGSSSSNSYRQQKGSGRYYTVPKTRDRRVITGGKGSSSAGSKSYSSRSGRSYSSGNRSGSRSIRITPKSYSPRHYSGGSRRTIRRR